MKITSLARVKNTKVEPNDPVEKIWNLLAKREISLLAVVDSTDTLIGVIGEDDLLLRIVPDYNEFFSEFYPASPTLSDIEDKLDKEIHLTAKDVMNPKVKSIHEDFTVMKALSKMMVYRVRSLPIVDENNKYKGLLFEDDIMVYLFNAHKQLVKNKKRYMTG